MRMFFVIVATLAFCMGAFGQQSDSMHRHDDMNMRGEHAMGSRKPPPPIISGCSPMAAMFRCKPMTPPTA